MQARSGTQWFSLACARSTLAAAGRDGAGAQAAEAAALADRAMDDLRHASAAGYRIGPQYRREPTLALLRTRDDFRLLRLDLEFPAEPFAR